MPKKAPPRPECSGEPAWSVQSQQAFERVIEEIHEEHRLLEGEALFQAVVEVFGLQHPKKTVEEPK